MKVVFPALFAALLGGCQMAGDSFGPVFLSGGIDLLHPVAGQNDRYLGYRLGSGSARELKSYTEDYLLLRVDSVDDDSIFLTSEYCFDVDPSCHRNGFSISRNSGKVASDPVVGSFLLTPANAHPKGILSEDFSREIAFEGRVPVTGGGPEVGFAKTYVIKGHVFKDVIVMSDPTGIPYDAGGHAFVLTKERKILDIFTYASFGVDGGWELQLH